MALIGFFGGKRHERAGFALYTAAVRAARNPYFYAQLEVPDTVDGRFDMIGLFTVLLINRLRKAPPPGPELAQAVFDAMFSDMDHGLREQGVGDMTVARKVKAMWEALHGRSAAYEQAFDDGDLPALAAAIGRNVWRGTAPAASPDCLAEVAMRQRAHLATQPLAALLAGQVDFLAPQPVVA